MKRTIILCSFVAALLLFPTALFAQEQDDSQEIENMAAEQAEVISKQVELNDYQLYQVDSALPVNYAAMIDELNKIRKSGAQNQEMYKNAQEKYLDFIDEAYQRIMTGPQWEKYMKSSYGKAMKRRESDRIKAEKKKKNPIK